MVRTAMIALMALAACPRSPETIPAMSPAVELNAHVLEAGEEWPEPTARAQEGGLLILGKLDAPTPCQNISGEMEQQGQQLIMRVAVRPTGDMCTQQIATFGYEAKVRNVAPGSYDLRVVHTYPEAGWSEQAALETQVTVR